MKATPKMLLKTNVEKMSLWGIAAMFMKTKDIQADTCDVDENTRDSTYKAQASRKAYRSMSCQNVDELPVSVSEAICDL
jgi:hypothetical protein